MAKQLNVNLNVQANVRDAKKNLEELSSVLNKISVSTKLDINDNSLKEAKQAAIDLQQHLSKAVNTDTGKLDLNKFSQSLQKSGQDLQSLYTKLSKIGPEGQSAFLRLAQSISQADSSALNLGNKLTQLGTTLKNTARWQISSSILHGFMGALQGAYGYAQDLNKSLNNIRIVTGQSTDQMAKFAEEANRAAKSLSTSTTAYTDAALIYYQQGLTDKAVKERTETTLKLSNVSRQSAEEVSSQMTAIWNNFADGSKNLEYYADVITKLGAATAASSAEISDGLQKFAAVADTVGLSYEKATAALATVVAETRQSADVVGTAFKTMFARFQGLELGETLEDGVTLNKYSEAINTVGVSILKANGDLKDMDTILDELGERWNSIGQAQKVALAETVAGTRQYAQFMAIMENYDKILANQDLAAGAEGTLQKQADIYAESWEAAGKRVRAAAQGIYQDLIDDKFFITALNGFEKFLTGINNVIDGLGGLKGILLLISSIFMQHYAKEIPNMITNLTSNISVLTGVAERRKQQQLEFLNTKLQEMSIDTQHNQALSAEQQMIQTTTKMTAELNLKRKQLSDTEIQAYETKIRLVEAYGRQTIAIGAEIEALNREATQSAKTIQAQISRQGNWSSTKKDIQEAEKRTKALNQFKSTKGANGTYINSGQFANRQKGSFVSGKDAREYIENEQFEIDKLKGGKNLLKELQETTAQYGKMTAAAELAKKTSVDFQSTFDTSKNSAEKMSALKVQIEECRDKLKEAGFNVDDLNEALDSNHLSEAIKIISDIDNDTNSLGSSFVDTEERIQQVLTALEALGADSKEVEKLRQAVQNSTISQEEFNARVKEMANDLDKAVSHSIPFSEALGQMAGLITQVTMAINAIKNLGNIWSNENLSNGEKMLQTFTAFGTLLPVLINLFKASNLEIIKNMFSTKGWTVATVLHTGATGAATTAQIGFNAALLACPIGWIIAGVAALAAGLYFLAKAIETPTEKLKRLKKEQEELKETVDSVKNKWEEFNNTIANYDEALNGLKKLIIGTTEFNEKLTETNELAKQLIKTLSLKMFEDYIIDQNGAIIYTNRGQQKIVNAQQQGQKAQSALDWAVMRADNDIEELDYYTNPNYQNTYEIQDQIFRDRYNYYVNKQGGLAQSNEYGWVHNQVLQALKETGYVDESGHINTLAYEDQDFIKSLPDILKNNNEYGPEISDYDNDNYQKIISSILESVKNENSTRADFQFNYDDEILHLAQQLDSSDKFANLVAKNAFGDQSAIQKTWHDIGEQVKADYTEQTALNELKEKFSFLDDDTFNKLIDDAGGAIKFLTGLKINDEMVSNATVKLQQLNQSLNRVSSENKDTITNLLLGNSAGISPEEIKRLREQGLGADKDKYINMYQQLNPKATAEMAEKHFNSILIGYDASKYYRAQIQGLDSLKESMANYNKELKSLKLGDTISLDIYKDLSENAKTYFTLMEDGTYRLIGNAQQLQDVLFKENTIGFENDLQTYQDIKDNGYNEIQIGPNGQYASEYHGGLTPEEQQAMQDTAIAYATTTETLEQLNYVKQRFNEIGIDTETQTLAEHAALQDLATKYESCTDDLEAYQHALTTNNKELAAAAQETLKYSIAVAELAEKHGFDAKETEAYAKRLKNNLSAAMKEAGFSEKQLEKSALTAAIANQRLDRGLLSLNKNLETYKKSLSSADKNSIEWSNTMDALKTDLADILNMDISVLTDEFAQSLLTDATYSAYLTQALDGNVEAILKLREIAADQLIIDIKTNLEEAKEDMSGFKEQWDTLKAAIAENLETGGLDQTSLVNSFNDLIEKGHMTKDQIEAALAGINVAADIETTYNKQPVTVPTTITEQTRYISGYDEIQDIDGKTRKVARWRTETNTFEGEPKTVIGYVPTYSIKGNTNGKSSSTTKIDPGNPPPVNKGGNKGQTAGISSYTDTGTGNYSNTSSTEVITDAFSPLVNEDKGINFVVPSYSSTTTGIKDGEKDKGGGSEKEATGQAELIEDEEHRYDELNKTLQGLSQQYERLGKARDRAWGKNKIALLEQEMQKLKQMQQVYEKYLKTVAGDDWEKLAKILGSGGNLGSLIAKGQAGGNLQKDYNKIVTSMADAIQYITKDEKGNQQRKTIEWQGLAEMLHMDIILDEFGQIANRDDIEEALEAWWNEHVLEWDRHNTDPQWQEEHDTFLQEAEAIREYAEKLLNQYDDSINVFTENYDKWMDNMYEQQAKAYETFRYKVDLKVEISERSLKRIEYAIKVLGDNIYKVPEVMRSWFDKRVTDTKAEVINQGSTWASAYQEAQALYSSGQISQEDYVQTIKDAQDGLYGCVDALLEINEEMREYYKNVLSKVKDEMSRITNEMDHQLNTVTHLANVLSLLGRETDYEAMGKILDAQLQMSRNGYEVSKAQTEMQRRQYEAAQADLQDLMASGVSEAALEEWKNAVLYPAKEALLEAEAEMEADFEAYLEVINSIYENRINQIYQDSERRLSGAWGSFDQVNNALERQHALDDEYLTKTNQIYETNVLIKKLAQDLDKTNNDSAKLRIKNFSAEIEGLQQKNKLSKSELDIAKARYEVLLAEIALEDARNAKSTVRLQRDNEGNYGYVYTADGEQVDAAEDDLAKKNNDLYNLVLGQANDYTQKIIQLTQERNAALKELDMAWAEGRIADEETYNKLREDINNKYNALIEEDYESYYRALYWLDQTAVTDHTEAWGTSFQDILDAGEDFKNETDTLMHETGETIDWLNGMRQEATEEAKVGAGELEQQLEDLTKQNDALAKTMIEEVIPASEEALNMAQKLTDEWIRQYDEIMALIDAYLQLIDAMNAALNEMAGVNEEEFDANKDYSLAATQKFLETGVIDNDVIQQLLFRAQKEELNGGHNDKWWTNDQILELMDIASRGDNDARSADAMAFLQGIAGINGESQYYTSDRLAELGITGEGYSLEEFAKRLEENTAAQTEANRLAEETKAQAESAQEATEESTEKTDENTEQSANTAQSIQDTAAAITEDFQTLANETTGHFDETIQGTENIIKENSNNLINALNQNANVVSAAVQAAAQVIALSISQAAEYASRAEAAAAEAQAAAAESIGGADGLASGGYTGAWGSSGKLAVLHEKELVLNASDTENILSAISLVRDFASAIDLRAAASNISTGLSSPAYEAGSQTLEQSVTIHAEFPNATNHSEIEEAFSNLVNRASQYANRS